MSIEGKHRTMTTLHIVGSGAIGSLLAAGAHKHKIHYALYPRTPVTTPVTPPDKSVSNTPGYVQWTDGTQYPLTQVKTNKQPLFENDILLLPLKVYQLESALTEWRSLLSRKTPVILLHNGLGGYEIAQKILPDSQPLVLATTSHGAMKQHDNSHQCHVVYTGVGATQLGLAPHLIPKYGSHNPVWFNTLQQTLNSVLPPVQSQQNILSALWAKLAINSVINPLTALNDIPNARICDDEFATKRKQLCEEFVLVARACGFCFEADDIEQRVIKVATLTGKNYSSMHQDVMHNRTTEIDAINGYLVQLANKKGIEVPLNTFLVEQIKAL